MIRAMLRWIGACALVLTWLSYASAAPAITMELGVGRMDRTEVRATVTQEDGRPMTRATVAFYLLPDFFPNEGKRLNGTNPVLLGTDTTDTTGTAAQAYEAPFSGRATFEARLLDDGGRTVTSETLVAPIERASNPAPVTVSQPLEAIRTPFGFAIVGLVASLWLFFALLTVWTVATIRRAGREQDTGRGATA